MPTPSHLYKRANYLYELPDHRIARYPVSPRDSSKLMVYQAGDISHHTFSSLPHLLPANTLLMFNNSRVVPARLHFTKSTGAIIEVFITEPVNPALVPLAMESRQPVVWSCLVGNKKRWKEDELTIQLNPQLTLTIAWHNRELNHVKFSWNDDTLSFADIIELSGKVPLPPYLAREAEEQDKETYQTVYSTQKGAVAAPTAGLHFTDKVLAELKQKQIQTDFLTLHVSAGTFKPVTVDDIHDHDMHTEQLQVSQQNIQNLLSKLDNVVAVGTTSMRVLESLYWFGVRILHGEDEPLFVPKLYPYGLDALPSSKEALTALLTYMANNHTDSLNAATQIMIVPGYTFRVCKGLVTNYHQPGSTLTMLVAAFVGEQWKTIYQEALNNNYRFLSYGDSSLLLP